MSNDIIINLLQLIDFSNEDDFLIPFPFRDSVSVSFDTVNGCDHTKRFRGVYSKEVDSVQSESMEPRRPSFLCKSLAWDSAFFTSEGVLSPEELFSINKGFRRPESNQPSDGFHPETLERDLFKHVKSNNIHKLGKRSKVGTNIGGSAAFGQPNSLSCNKTESCSRNKVKLLQVPKSQSLNPQVSTGMTKKSIKDPRAIEDKVSSQPKLISSRQTTKGAAEGSDDMKMEHKTRKAGFGPDLSVSKRSRWGDSSRLPKSSSFTSPKSTEKDSKLHRPLDSSSSASSSKPLRRKTNPRNTKLYASASSVHFSLASISSSSATSPATPIDGCFSESLSSNSTTHQNPATNFHNAMLASDFQDRPLTPSQKPEERKFATIPFSGGPKRKIKSSGLRLPSPKIGFFDVDQPLQPNFRRITQVEFEGRSPSPNENRLNKLLSSNLSPRVFSENCSRMRQSYYGEHDGRKVSASCSKVQEIPKKKMKVKDEDEGTMKKKQVEEGQKENVCSFEDEVNGFSRELEVIDLIRDSEVKVDGQLSVDGTPDHCSRTPLIEKTFVSFDTVNGCDHTKRFRGGNSQVVEQIDHVQSESMEPRRPSFLCKSLAWDSAFFTSAGVLNSEELFLINKGFRRAESNQPSDETLEGDLFKHVKPNKIHKLGKRSIDGTNIGGSAFGQPNSLSCNKTESCSPNKVKLLRAPKSQSLNPQVSKGMTKTSINDPRIIQDKVSSQPKLQTTKGAAEGSDDMKMEHKTRKAGFGPDLSVSKRSRWGDSSRLPKSSSFTSPKSTEKDSKLHRPLDSSSSASSSKPLRGKTNPRNTKLPASASSVHFSLASISSSSATSPATPIDGCFSESLSSNSTTHQNPATNFQNAMLASDFQDRPLTPSQKPEERKFATIPFSGGPKRKIKSSGLRLPSPKIGFFDVVRFIPF